MTPEQQKVYDQCMRKVPTSRLNGIGSAYYYGLEHPDRPPGARGGAWRAARVCGCPAPRPVPPTPSGSPSIPGS